MQKDQTPGIFQKHTVLLIPGSAFLISALLFLFADFFAEAYDAVVSNETYLMLHNVLEISGSIVCFAVFLVAFYTYDRTRSLRIMVFGSFMLTTGFIDMFHTFSFKGMPYFLGSNLESNRATTLWIISRIIASAAFLIISFMDLETKSTIKKWIFLVSAIAVAVGVLLVATYFPNALPMMYVEGSGLTLVKKILEVLVAILFLAAIFNFLRAYYKTGDRLLVLLTTALVFNIFSELSFICYGQVHDSYNFAGHIFKAMSYFFILRVMYVRNVQLPYDSMLAAQQELKNYVDNLDRIVEQRTRQLKQMNRKLLDDLEYARDIQKALLPAVLPDVKGLSFSAFYYPAERLSGDFYDIYRINDHNIGMYICDVSGHGVPAAMLTVFLKQCIETRLETDTLNERVSAPSEVLQSVYDSFNNTNFKDEVYIVLVYALFNTDTFEMTYSSAGMNVAPLVIKRDGEIEEIPVHGFPICKFKGVFDVRYQDTTVKLERGDRILFYSDGLIEVENISGEQFSAGRLTSILYEHSGETGENLSSIIYEKLFKFIDNRKIKDDITYYIMDIAG